MMMMPIPSIPIMLTMTRIIIIEYVIGVPSNHINDDGGGGSCD